MNLMLKDQGVDLVGASPTSKGKALTEWYVKNIANHIDKITDEGSINEGIECDGNNDLGIDFIYEKDDNSFWICQSKYLGEKTSLKKDAISDFFQIHRRIFDKDARSSANQQVQNLLPDINSKPSITFVLLINKKITARNEAEFNRLNRQVSREENAEKYQWRLVDLPKVKESYHEIHTPTEIGTVKIPILREERYIDLSDQISTNGKDYKTIVTVIDGNTLKGLYKEHKTALFNHNIRGFLGNSIDKNKTIQKTLKETPELFYLYNNGISAICKKMEISNTPKEIVCEGFSIINGAQTSCCIGDFQDTDNLKKVKVLIRITEAGNNENAKELNKNIVKYNNTQNVIRDADFRSNDTMQVMLQERFRDGQYRCKVGSKSKVLEYMPKRIKPDSAKKTISLENMARMLYSFNIAFGGRDLGQNNGEKEISPPSSDDLHPQSTVLFDDNDGGFYQKMFGRETDQIHQKKAEEFAAIAMLDIYLNDRIKEDAKKVKEDIKLHSNSEIKNLDKHEDDLLYGMVYRSRKHFLRAFGYMIRNFYSSEQQETIRKEIINGNAFKEGGFVANLYKKVARVIHSTLFHESRKGSFNFLLWDRSYSGAKSLITALNYIYRQEHEDLPKT